MLIDIHTHCCPRRPMKIIRTTGGWSPTPERLIEMMDAADIDRAVVLSDASPDCSYNLVPPHEVLDICAQHPDRFIPFANMDPRNVNNNPKSDFRPILKAYKDAGCKGIGEYCPNLHFDDPLNMNLFAQVEEIGLPLLFHIAPAIGGYYGCVDEVGLIRFERVLRAFPRLVFLGHSQYFWAEVGTNLIVDGHRTEYPAGKVVPGRLLELLRKYPNLYGDLSAGSGHNAISRDLEFGCAFMEEFQDRLCFGTDICSDPQPTPIVPFFKKLKAEKLISESAYEKITWRNANRLLGLGLE